MSKTTDPPPASAAQLAADIGTDVAAIDRELAEIDMLVGQARAEAARHEQKRAQLNAKLTPAEGDRAGPPRPGHSSSRSPGAPC